MEIPVYVFKLFQWISSAFNVKSSKSCQIWQFLSLKNYWFLAPRPRALKLLFFCRCLLFFSLFAVFGFLNCFLKKICFCSYPNFKLKFNFYCYIFESLSCYPIWKKSLSHSFFVPFKCYSLHGILLFLLKSFETSLWLLFFEISFVMIHLFIFKWPNFLSLFFYCIKIITWGFCFQFY